MNWKKEQEEIYFRDGSFRDIVIENTSIVDWNSLVCFLNENYKIKQKFLENGNEENFINFDFVKKYWSGDGAYMSNASIYLDNIIVNTHFFSDVEIEFDVNPTEINSFEDHQKVVSFIKRLSNLLKKEVFITPEDEHNIKLFSSKDLKQ